MKIAIENSKKVLAVLLFAVIFTAVFSLSLIHI